MTFKRLEELTFENYKSGMHGRRHIAMSSVLYSALTERLQVHRGKVLGDWSIPAIAQMFGVPITVVDSHWAENCWRLTETFPANTIVEHGYVLHFRLDSHVFRDPVKCFCGELWPCAEYDDGTKAE